MQDKVFGFVQTVAGAAGYLMANRGPYKVLDIGSYDVNGCLKPLFRFDAEYTGLDMREGPNVDIVGNSHEIPFSGNHFDLVTCVDSNSDLNCAKIASIS